MNPQHMPEPLANQDRGANLSAMFGRLLWMLIGPLVLLLAFIIILYGPRQGVGAADIFYLAVVLLMCAGRWLEYHSGHAMTAQGEPATPQHLRRYVVTLLVFAGIAWIVAHLIGTYLF